MKIAKAATIIAAGALICAALPATAFSQATRNQYVADFGLGFAQATVRKAQMGFAGLDLQVGKMLTNSISVGLSTGFDICSFRAVEYPDGGTVYERLGVIPILAKARYNLNVAPLAHIYASVAAGAYQTVPHLNTTPIGGVWKSGLHPGGAASIGFDYYLFGMQGIGAEFEYNFFDSDSDELFSYFAVRLKYSIIKM
ncbi:MAG: hypothetical protein C4574_02580 [Candidatus Latescibacterota bacterium]|nr:MAG: hypothetical protein C4574_02580 [Candidatus Latescibacterota bacterium]